MAGTAPDGIAAIVAIEDRSSWRRKAFYGLAEADRNVVDAFVDRTADALGAARPQALRRPQMAGALTVVVADVARSLEARLELSSYRDLRDLDPSTLALAPVTEPTFLVCTHGKRDACCARYGVAVYQALEALGVRVWQTTHTGGHRFAASVIALPSGRTYGRVQPSEVADMVAAERRGEVYRPGDRYRGRCADPRPAQFAEVWLRRQLGVFDGRISVHGWTKNDDTYLIDLDSPIDTIRVRVVRRTFGPSLKSCDKDGPEMIKTWAVDDAPALEALAQQ